ncbi:MAG TPA: AI-2E family transporter [Clostridiaceae bacterium]|nr:AI-2E family transporter [Clostridiaceae bacterium]
MECDDMNDSLPTLVLSSIGIGTALETLIGVGLLILLALIIYYLLQIGNTKVPDGKKLRFGIPQMKLTFFLLLGIFVLWWILKNQAILFPILTPFIVAGVFAYAFNPLVTMLMKLRLSRVQSTAIIFVGLILALTGFSFVFFPMMVNEITRLMDTLPELSQNWYARFTTWYQETLAFDFNLPTTFEDALAYFNIEVEAITDWLFRSSGSLFTRLGSFASNLVHVVTIPVITFYFMKDGDKIADLSKKAVLPKAQPWVFPLADKIDDVLGGFIRGQLLVAFILGILSSIALLVLGVEYWLILGLLAGVGNLIPYIGPFLGAIPAVFIALTTDPWKALWVIAAFIIIQQIESNVISPKIVGHSVGLHPALIIFVLLIGGALWGLVGLLIAVPLAGVLKVLLVTILQWFQKTYPKMFTS